MDAALRRRGGGRWRYFFGEYTFLDAASFTFVFRNNKCITIYSSISFLIPLDPVSSLPLPPPIFPHALFSFSLLLFLLNYNSFSLSHSPSLFFTLYIGLNGIVMRRPRLQFPLYRLFLLLFPLLSSFISFSTCLSLILLSPYLYSTTISF